MPGRGPSIRRCRFIRGLAFAFLAVALPAAAEDLLQVYREAQRYDAVYGAARFSLEAGRERIPQGGRLAAHFGVDADLTHGFGYNEQNIFPHFVGIR